MSDSIWIYDYAGSSLSRPFVGDWKVSAEEWPSERHHAMRWQSGFSIQRNVERWLSLGDPIEPVDIARDFIQTLPEGVANFEPEDLEFSPIIELRGIPALRADVAAVFTEFNLGSGWLKPVTLYLEDRVTKVDQKYYVLSVSEKKQTVDLERTTCARPIFPNNPVHSISIPRGGNVVKEIFTHSDALAGADIWKDPMIAGANFISGRFQEALAETGYDRILKVYPCTMI